MDKKIKCPKCGHMNDSSAEYCSNCGYKLHATKEASTLGFIQSMYKTAMSCPTATGDIALNTKNRDKTIKEYNYGPLNLSDKGYWEFVADKWNTTPEVAKKSKCGNCVAFDVSPRMDDCMPGQVSDKDGRLGYCWMHHFKCHSARTCTTWAKGGPIKEDETSHDWQKKAKGMEKEASAAMPLLVGGGLVGAGLGAVADKDNRLRGAAIGGGLGALGGFAGGKAIDHMVATDPGVIRARAGVAKAEADLQQTIADGKAQAKKLDADLAEAKKKTERANEVNKQIKSQLEQVTADEKAGKISPMEASSRRLKIIQSMANAEKKAAADEYDDSHMLSKILLGIAEQSEDLREKIDNGLVLPSWAEYKVYGAYDNIKGALGASYMQEEISEEEMLDKEAAGEEDDTKSMASLAGAGLAAGGLSKAMPMTGNFAKKNPTARAMLYTGGLFTGGYAARKAVDSARRNKEMLGFNKEADRFSIRNSMQEFRKLAGSSSSMVKSPDAYYAPPTATSTMDLSSMNTGNMDTVANSSAAAKQNSATTTAQNSIANLAPAQMPPIPMTPMVQPPFRPKYTGM